jgi:hypothetical protein
MTPWLVEGGQTSACPRFNTSEANSHRHTRRVIVKTVSRLIVIWIVSGWWKHRPIGRIDWHRHINWLTIYSIFVVSLVIAATVSTVVPAIVRITNLDYVSVNASSHYWSGPYTRYTEYDNYEGYAFHGDILLQGELWLSTICWSILHAKLLPIHLTA